MLFLSSDWSEQPSHKRLLHDLVSRLRKVFGESVLRKLVVTIELADVRRSIDTSQSTTHNVVVKMSFNLNRSVEFASLFGIYIAPENANRVFYNLRRFAFFILSCSTLQPIVSSLLN